MFWLKEFDRALWYALQNDGRKMMFVEGAGISAHYMAEREALRAIAEPQVAGAVEGLEDYLKKRGLIETLQKEPMA